MLPLLGLVLVGGVAGMLGALLGLGGGIFLVPALTLLFGVPVHAAVGTGLVCVIATSAGVASMAERGRGADMVLAMRLEATTAAGAIAGATLAGRVGQAGLSILFGVVVFLTAIYLWTKARTIADPEEDLFGAEYRVRHWPGGLAGSSLAGVVSGMLGIGGGFIKVPLMHALMGVPLGVAAATSNLMVGITACASVFVYYGRGDVHPMLVVPAAAGVYSGALLGTRLLPRVRASWLRWALIALLVYTGAQMLQKGMHGG